MIYSTQTLFLGTFIFLSTLSASRNLQEIAKEVHPLFLTAHWGMHVVDLENRQMLYTHNAAQLFVPASVTKLFTTAAALEVLGPSHLFHTRVKASALPDNEGIIRGNIYLAGGGDPSLTSQGLNDLAARVHEAGVRTILGEVLVDDSLFEGSSLPTHAEWEDLPFSYAAEISSLTVNSNCVEITVSPDPENGNVKIEQDVPYCLLTHQVKVDPTIQKPHLKITRDLADNVIKVSGDVPVDFAPIKASVTVHRPHEMARMIFLKALRDRGVVIQNAPSEACGHLYEIASISSPPVHSIIQRINKFSDNLFASLLLVHANAQIQSDALKYILNQSSIPTNQCALHDGSGLSRHNSISPEQTTRFLAYMHDGVYKHEFLESLASPGAKGSLEGRLTDRVIKAKTGGMSGVSNLAGYLYRKNKSPLAFAIFINHSLWSNKETSAALDGLLRQIFIDNKFN